MPLVVAAVAHAVATAAAVPAGGGGTAAAAAPRAVAQASGASDSLAVADSLTAWIVTLLDRADWANAASTATRLVALRRTFAADARSLATSLTYLSLAERNLGRFAAAETAAREVVAIAHASYGPEHPTYATALNNLAGVLRERGELVAAEALYRRSLATRVQAYGTAHATVAASYNNLATVLQQQGDFEAAEPLFRQALASARASYGDDHPNVAMALENLATVLRRQGNVAEAEQSLREALELVTRRFGAEHVRTAYALQGLAEQLADAGRTAEADSLLRACLALRERTLGPEHVETAQTRDRLGAVLSTQGHAAEAVILHEQALRAVQASYGNAHPRAAATLLLLGGARLRSGDTAGAESALQRAAQAFEQARVRAASGLRRATLELTSPYPLLAAARLRQGHGEAAWQASELAQGRVLAELLAVTRGGALAPALRAQRDSLVQHVGRLEAEVTRLEQPPKDSDPAPQALVQARRAALLDGEAALAALQERIVREHPIEEGHGVGSSTVQATLGAHEAMLGWLDADDPAGAVGRWVWVLRAKGPVQWIPLPLPPPGVSADSTLERSLCRALRKGSTALGTAEALLPLAECRAVYTARLAPALAVLEGIERLIVIPAGGMLGVPVEALIDEQGATVLERFAVAYAPSGTVWQTLTSAGTRAAEPAARRHALLLGDPPFRAEHLEQMRADAAGGDPAELHRGDPQDADSTRATTARTTSTESLRRLPRLRWSRREIQAVAPAFDAPLVLLGAEASEQRLDALVRDGRLAEFGTLHFATHALANAQRPEDGALVLAQTDLPDALEAIAHGEPAFDGLVTAREIIATWHLHADLVTLSACETALGRAAGGEGYLGLAHALLQAGSRSVLVSLWSVDDRATALLMEHFYRDATRANGGSLSAALRNAKLWLRSFTDAAGRHPFAHPRYWAGFVLLGGDP